MSARGKARKRALDALYSAELRGVSPLDTLAERMRAESGSPANPYARTLVSGVSEHAAEIDQLLSRFSEGWELDRMPAVDRNVLRLGVYELLHCPDVPNAVAIDEAVALVSQLSTDESPAFVNGLLARISQEFSA
ncbi:MAG: transcription antitermination factor NusB [Candidatus Nanopelagicales bacterium]